MQAIGRAAGVGQGTLYRHFPTRESLLLEVYDDDFQNLIEAAATVHDAGDPVGSLRSWLDHLAAFGRKKHALSDVLRAAARRELHDRHYALILEAIDGLLDDGRRTGEIRRDLDADELLALVSFLWQIDTTTDERVPHLLDLVVDGCRTPRGKAHQM